MLRTYVALSGGGATGTTKTQLSAPTIVGCDLSASLNRIRITDFDVDTAQFEIYKDGLLEATIPVSQTEYDFTGGSSAWKVKSIASGFNDSDFSNEVTEPFTVQCPEA